MHGKVPSGKGNVPGPKSHRGTNIIGPISNIEYPLEGVFALSLLLPRQVLLKDHLLAHVVRTTGALVGMKGEQDKPAGPIKAGGVCENLSKKVAHAGTLQPRLDEVRVGVRYHCQLKVLLVALQILQQVQEARSGRDLLHRRLNGVLGHALLGHVDQHLLHVLIVVPFSVAVLQPVGEPSARQGAHHGVVAALVDDGLVEVKQHQKAPVLWRRVALV